MGQHGSARNVETKKMKYKVLILGSGLIGRAIAGYVKDNKTVSSIVLFSNNRKELQYAKKEINSKKIQTAFGKISEKKVQILAKQSDFIFNALPGEIGLQGMELAVKAGKNIIDVSDLDYAEYKHLDKEAKKKGIVIIPECGVSPGLSNLIVGGESRVLGKINSIEIKAGTLAPARPHFFPVTWNINDLIAGHLLPATIIQDGKKKKLPPFSGYQKELLKKTGEFETYIAEGLSTLPNTIKAKSMTYRVIRPAGFMDFFLYMKNHNLLDDFSKGEFKKEDNTTLLLITIAGKDKRVYWSIMSSAKKNEKLNSMQKITGLVPATVFQLFVEGKIKEKGIVLMEQLGRKNIFPVVIKKLKESQTIVREELLIKRNKNGIA